MRFADLADALMRNPVSVQVAAVSSTADNIAESVYFVDRGNKPQLLAHLVGALPMTRAIVFTRTKHGADRVVRHLHTRGIRAEAIHGNKSQNARQRALDNFKANRIPVLVATDIASRGIDVDGVTHVVNYDLTHEPETYVHRIGRTARAGASGAAVSFCDRDERSNLRAIEKLIKRSIPIKTDHPTYAAGTAHPAAHSRPTAHTTHSRPSTHTQHASQGKPQAKPHRTGGGVRPHAETHHPRHVAGAPKAGAPNAGGPKSGGHAEHPRSNHGPRAHHPLHGAGPRKHNFGSAGAAR